MITRRGGFFLLALPLLAQTYFPGPHNEWERRAPAQVGMNPKGVEEAIASVTATWSLSGASPSAST
jgi:hypothetical protein